MMDLKDCKDLVGNEAAERMAHEQFFRVSRLRDEQRYLAEEASERLRAVCDRFSSFGSRW
ncbi:MAG: hypothetical protein IJS28_09245 [Synergistaceae bacterium]|nr:hypothetical protein [Synergistaceae bacterium]